tara:strand:+ start:1582 stop:1734 length:153 start_codon:yes stop_codon:yes gene_type:complete
MTPIKEVARQRQHAVISFAINAIMITAILTLALIAIWHLAQAMPTELKGH